MAGESQANRRYLCFAKQADIKRYPEVAGLFRSTVAEAWSNNCPLAALQFEEACGKRPLHPVEVLERAYRADGSATAVAPPAGAAEERGR